MPNGSRSDGVPGGFDTPGELDNPARFDDPPRFKDPSRFKDRVAIVTGAASGIGRALSAALVRRGAHVVLADVDEQGANTAADTVRSWAASEVTAVGLDVRDAAAFAEVAERTARDRGRLDFVFNNAGIGIAGPVAQMTVEHFDRLIDVNLRGVVHGVMAAYPIMIRQGGGHLVNTASLAGLLPSPMLTGYGMTKHGVVGLSLGLRMEAAAHHVRVSVVCPGLIDTPLLDKPNPTDLPQVEGVPTVRDILTRVMGEAYSAAALAEDVLAGVARDRPLIVTPRHARIPWYLYRASPRLILEGGPRALQRVLSRRTQRGSESHGPSR